MPRTNTHSHARRAKLFYIHICQRCGDFWLSKSKSPRVCPQRNCWAKDWNKFSFSRRCKPFLNMHQLKKWICDKHFAIMAMTPSNVNKDVLEQLRKESMGVYLSALSESHLSGLYEQYKEMLEQKEKLRKENLKCSSRHEMSSKARQKYYRSIKYIDSNYFRVGPSGWYAHLPS